MGSVSTEVVVHGPLTDGRAAGVLRDIEDQWQQQVAAQASSYVHEILNARIRNPTPYYETQIMTERAGADMVVHDRGIVYGPWLEGTGSRNRTTRFKGYRAFRESRQRLESDVMNIADQVVARNIDRLR